MVRKICLDSDVLIDLLRKKETTINLIESLNAYFITTSISVFETMYGKKEGEGVEKLANQIKILNFDKESAIEAANILTKLKKDGSIIDHRDLFIASICIQNNIELLTYNKKHFSRLQKFGLKLA